MDANGAFFVSAHGSSSLPALLAKQARARGSHRGRGDACCEYGASDWIHHRPAPVLAIERGAQLCSTGPFAAERPPWRGRKTAIFEAKWPGIRRLFTCKTLTLDHQR